MTWLAQTVLNFCLDLERAHCFVQGLAITVLISPDVVLVGIYEGQSLTLQAHSEPTIRSIANVSTIPRPCSGL
jgi:hypothetical protein